MASRHQARLRITTTLSALVFAAAMTVTSPVWSASQAELKGVSSEISRQRQSLSSQQKQLDSLQKSLKQQEVGIARIEKEIKETKTLLSQTNSNISALEKKVEQLEDEKKQQSEKLAELLKTYYVTQRAKDASNLLNQGVEEDRISQYFQHLAKQRAHTIEELEQTAQELADSRTQLDVEKNQLTRLLDEQTEKRNQLTQVQSKRKSTLSGIRKQISNDRVYLSELQRNETRLKAEIAKAAKRNAVPMDGLARQQGKLPWPLKGRVLHNYGTRQTGQLNWKGMVIDANYGQSVKAVYSGTVVFADYLRGYGLVVLLDHGKGDMTLYGFNQSLLKKEGDKVKANETIALAGDTGGQAQASLYFEIRRNSKTQNPRRWLTQ
ncbi:murein hydrolase activator EnvC family protein [Vibrio hepatarius]|uniref:murein hydrolase activator EnvC family protein n=1 Tax=Vibrio hepatarius TaxID=171383 RepID=UPI00148CF1F3|nr:murein hydrolase activator EnvC [Vibrio hepatarius]NOI16436.1 murein hydrolase activator EnvC [Vibrio hepatarius]